MRQLQAREKIFLAVGAAVVGVTLGGWLVQRLVLQRLAFLDRQLAARDTELAQMQGLLERYHTAQERLSTLELRLAQQQGTLLDAIDELVTQAQLKSHLDSTQTQRETEADGFLVSTVELKFSRLHFPQIVELIRQLSFGPAVVRIQRLDIERRFEDSQQLDLDLALASYKPKP